MTRERPPGRYILLAAVLCLLGLVCCWWTAFPFPLWWMLPWAHDK